MDLPTLWFWVIAALWTGYFFLEGFDFGVGMLTRLLARDNTERRVLVNTIGPVWDGNEVWVIVAIGATFAAFPPWYATMLSAEYLPVLLILLALIGRGVAFEYRGKVDSDRWRRGWDLVILLGSWIPPLGWGLVITGVATGLPIGKDGVLEDEKPHDQECDLCAAELAADEGYGGGTDDVETLGGGGRIARL